MTRIQIDNINEKNKKCQWCGKIIDINFESYVVYDTEKKCYWHDICHPLNFKKSGNGWC